jgi:hypothetical protein
MCELTLFKVAMHNPRKASLKSKLRRPAGTQKSRTLEAQWSALFHTWASLNGPMKHQPFCSWEVKFSPKYQWYSDAPSVPRFWRTLRDSITMWMTKRGAWDAHFEQGYTLIKLSSFKLGIVTLGCKACALVLGCNRALCLVTDCRTSVDKVVESAWLQADTSAIDVLLELL